MRVSSQSLVVGLADGVTDLGVIGIGPGLLGSGERLELLAAVIGLSVAVGERLLEDRAVALGAAGLADVRGGLVFEGMVAAVRPGAGQGV